MTSTSEVLTNILAGVRVDDEGTIEVRGGPVAIRSPEDAQAHVVARSVRTAPPRYTSSTA
jgi:ABC-type uncharacterized transport system ATPase subunit